MMVDMATDYDDLPQGDSPFAQMRDSLYILSVMNQCKFNWCPRTGSILMGLFADKINQDLVEKKEAMIAAEKLLRIAIFSDELPMTTESTTGLTEQRKDLAETIRAFRKKGVIPVFVSTLWFLLALAISIQLSFGNRESNQAAHDLALGLLLAFLPIFVLSLSAPLASFPPKFTNDSGPRDILGTTTHSASQSCFAA